MVAKISVGNSLYGALAYNGEKINKEEGRLLTTNRIYNDGTGTVDIRRAMEDFLALMPVRSKVEKPVVHISLNPHPDDMLTDTELQDIAREYLEKMGFGNQPYMVYKHEDIDRHHLHIVTVRVDGDGRSIDTRNNFYRSKQITRELERKYGLHDAERKSRRTDMPLHKVDVLAGDVKKQAGNVVKELNRRYRFQTMGEYRALLSLYNMTVEEARGNVRGREYNGLVYSVTDDSGNKVGNPFKSSLFGKSVGYDAVQRKFARSKTEIKDRKLADMTKRTVLSVLQGTYDKERFIATLKEKGIDTVLRYTEEGRIYGATFIDHRTGCASNGSRMAGNCPPTPCRNTSRCHTPDSRRFRFSLPRRVRRKRKLRPLPNTEGTWTAWACSLPKARQWTPRRKPSSGRCSAGRKRRSARAWECNQSDKVSTIKTISRYVTTRRRFEGIGENHGFSACREYYFSGHERVLVLL